MKKIYSFGLLALFILGIASCSPKSTESGQNEEMVENSEAAEEQEESRPSPLEIKDGQIAGKSFKIQYGSPAVKERMIWGDLVPYNVVWRTGANEATYVDLAEDMTVEGKSLAAGKYSLFTIPKENGAWTVIFNSEWNLEHGHFQYDEKNDVLRVEVMPTWEENSQERLSIDIESPGIVIRWEKLKLPITIQ
ncbi:DUF2911 domain-containing protein [Algoriphagus sp. CAU 1675]|uniref:DUF2911 domain-containing protein n=1 Tax=Algoriphagus sp. CAU 1675 TaxID=3032597 RepID=UPI0023D98792|nr:DUF2911 domain-containing protein [Algoriphagus sp. CAU 1675]MDF2159421.1 DUF2911 domain-containing protein [Algoriphagus sp. CAU 1675]